MAKAACHLASDKTEKEVRAKGFFIDLEDAERHSFRSFQAGCFLPLYFMVFFMIKNSAHALFQDEGRQFDALIEEAVALAGGKKQAAALKLLERALALDPARDEAAAAMLLLLIRMKGQRAAEEALLRKLGLSGREEPRFQKLIADVLVLSDKPQDAVKQYESILARTPDYVEALSALGEAFRFLRRFDDAAHCFEKALKIKPSADILGKIGSLLYNAGHPAPALPYFDRALELAPNNRILLANRAAAAYHSGRFTEAFGGFHRMLVQDPTDAHAKRMLATTARNVHLENFSPTMKQVILDCLASDSIEHQYFMALWFESLTLDPLFAPLITAMRLKTWEDFCAGFDPSAHAAMLSDPYLCLGLRMLAMRNLDFERVLTFLRRALLTLAAEGGDSSEKEGNINGLEPFSCALAEHCFFNEYVFDFNAADEALAERATRLAADPATPAARARFCLTVAACCHPLSDSVPDPLPAPRLAALRCDAPPEFNALCLLQLDEPLEERAILPKIPVFRKISDGISQKVRDQYEENPYPRWRRTILHGAEANHSAFLRPLNILVAGCGTGRQPIDVHYAYPNAQITAVDLSRASLAYAIRKTREAKINKITYMQGDILDLGQMDSRFDLIMCSGVLHHMQDPEKGLAVLTGLLAPGGQINLGLYSELARKQVVEARNYAREKGWQGSVTGIRALRAYVAALPDTDPMRHVLSKGFDFYTTSSCRDLLFHVQEHRYTLPRIREILARHALSFLYFSTIQADFLQVFRKENPQAGACLDLDLWDAFEQANPDLFYGMYQFYVCRKEDEAAIRAAPRLVRAIEF